MPEPERFGQPPTGASSPIHGPADGGSLRFERHGRSDVLACIELFDGLPRVVESVAAAVADGRSRAGDVYVPTGDPAAELLHHERGPDPDRHTSPDGRESVVALMEAGDLFGEMSLFDGLAAPPRRGPSSRRRCAGALRVRCARRSPSSRPRCGTWSRPSPAGLTTDGALADAIFLAPGADCEATARVGRRVRRLRPATHARELSHMVGRSRERVNRRSRRSSGSGGSSRPTAATASRPRAAQPALLGVTRRPGATRRQRRRRGARAGRGVGTNPCSASG